MKFRLFLPLILTACYLASSMQLEAKQLVIVIDDVGNNERDLELINLPGALTFSVLPHTPYSQQFAFLASAKNKELLLHMPMQSLQNKKLGPGALTLDMNKQQMQNTLGHALATLPQVKGVNNHMGSALTQHSEPMKWIMEIIRKRGLFFLDSRTTEKTQAQHVASLFGVQSLRRHVFLDNDTHESALLEQLNRLKQQAQNNELAIAIAHPYPETITFLKRQLPLLKAQGFELVPLSKIMTDKYIQLSQKEATSIKWVN